ncbi:hypothetical protein Poly24_42390 [Rosistilla carotiformis]|uniref:Uncharacterized protein n=1 Tax=Rosistilla carotiformis TaxID=2528017 RepID=A0A518JYA2_9BACT|nr:hypothetical protein Poly24_42390 [Rosistilla carotiformis]
MIFMEHSVYCKRTNEMSGLLASSKTLSEVVRLKH